MAQITAAMVKSLRDKTGVGMMDCKEALAAAGGDLEKAHEFLRKKGIQTAASKAGRAAKEGKVVTRMSADGRHGAILAVRCETDFVVKNETFAGLVDRLAQALLTRPVQTTEEFMGMAFEGSTPDQKLKELVGVIGENMSVAAASTFEVDGTGRIGQYIHHNGKLGVMLSVVDPDLAKLDATKVQELLSDLCMQVAFSNPLALDKTGVDSEIVEKERAIYREQVKGKPAEITEKIVDGKVAKFFQDRCLVEQEFCNPAKFKGTVRGLMSQLSKTMIIKKFVRIELGIETE